MSAKFKTPQDITIRGKAELSRQLGEGKPALADSVEDCILTIQDILREISNLAHQAFCAAAAHPCVPASYALAWEDAHHKEAQKLRGAVGMNDRLKALYEEALVDANHRKRELAVLYRRIQELEDQISDYAMWFEESESGEQHDKTAKDEQLSDTTELVGGQTQEEVEIVDMISQTELVPSDDDPQTCDIQACDSSKRQASKGGLEDEYADVEEKPRKKRRTRPTQNVKASPGSE